MFVGHFAAGVTGKAIEDRVPLWVWIGASQLLDLGWAVLIMIGVEKVRVVPEQPGNPLDLYFMPWTHSLPAALVWASAAALVAWRGFGVPRRVAGLLGLVVFSHWLLDLIVHRPDLPLGFLGPKLGLGMWNLPLPEMALEMGLLALAGGLWIAARKDRGQRAGPALGFVALLSVLQMVSLISGEAQGPVQMGALALFGFGVAMGGAWLVDRSDRRISAGLAMP
nr:hypothetical protein [Polymorphobacter sp.]